jgi:hypothetical protein
MRKYSEKGLGSPDRNQDHHWQIIEWTWKVAEIPEPP